jgi:hypothetical protein
MDTFTSKPESLASRLWSKLPYVLFFASALIMVVTLAS